MLTQIRLKTFKYGSITLTNLQNQLAYVWDAAGRTVFIVMIMFIFVKLWTAVFENQASTEIAGLTLANTIWYFLVAEVMELSKVRHDMRISEEVKDGSIAYTLIRPYNYLAYHYFNGLGEAALRMVLIFVSGAPVALYYAGIPTLNWQQIFAFLLVAFGAMLLDFFALSMIGLLAFVTEDTSSFRLVYQKFTFILGGLMIPLDFLPDWLHRIAKLLPFHLTTYAPAKLFVSFDAVQFGEILRGQAIWLTIFGTALYFHYRWATKRLAVNGG